MRQEVSIAVAKHHVRDDLLVAWVVLDLGPRHEEVMLANDRLVAVKTVADEAMPRAVWKDVLPLDAEHLLRRCSHSLRGDRRHSYESAAEHRDKLSRPINLLVGDR